MKAVYFINFINLHWIPLAALNYCDNQVVIDSVPINWTSEIRYLGIYLKAGLVLKINHDYCKKKFLSSKLYFE